MNGDEHDQLWDLLGKAGQPGVSPFFARNVLRKIRRAQQERVRWAVWRWPSWRVAIPASVAALAVLFSFGVVPLRHQASRNSLDAEMASNPDYEVINHLDELVASEENALWTEFSVD